MLAGPSCVNPSPPAPARCSVLLLLLISPSDLSASRLQPPSQSGLFLHLTQLLISSALITSDDLTACVVFSG